MKTVMITFVWAISMIALQAQNTQSGSQAIAPVSQDDNMLVVHGRSDVQYTNSQYIPSEQWRAGYFIELNGKRVDLKEMRFDSYMNRIEYKSNGMLLTPQKEVIEFGFESGELFQSRFNPFDNCDEESVFQVLYNGKTKVLKRIKSTLGDITPYYSATKVKEFNFVNAYYVLKPNVKVAKSKKQDEKLLKGLQDKNPELEKFIKNNDLRISKTDDLKRIMSYYDSL